MFVFTPPSAGSYLIAPFTVEDEAIFDLYVHTKPSSYHLRLSLMTFVVLFWVYAAIYSASTFCFAAGCCTIG